MTTVSGDNFESSENVNWSLLARATVPDAPTTGHVTHPNYVQPEHQKIQKVEQSDIQQKVEHPKIQKKRRNLFGPFLVR